MGIFSWLNNIVFGDMEGFIVAAINMALEDKVENIADNCKIQYFEKLVSSFGVYRFDPVGASNFYYSVIKPVTDGVSGSYGQKHRLSSLDLSLTKNNYMALAINTVLTSSNHVSRYGSSFWLNINNLRLICDNKDANKNVIAIAKSSLMSAGCDVNKLHINHLDDESVLAIAEALKSEHCKIESLELGGQDITDASVAVLAESLKSEHCKIDNLELASNNITDASVLVLAEALKSGNCRIKNLTLYGNKITSTAIEAIITSSNERNKIEIFDFDFTAMSKDDIKKCLDLVGGNLRSKVIEIRFPVNGLTSEEKLEIEDQVASYTKGKRTMMMMLSARCMPSNPLSKWPPELFRLVAEMAPQNKNPAIKVKLRF